ncbi:MAG TPA: 50S ribosomal protein L18Ae [Methanocella sp.]|nr:50S ribosomal protein L18Ae [Methanocella sp.]
MATFVVQGKFKAGVQWERFTKEVEANGPKNAEEKVLSDFGSRHRVPRRLITIESVKEA